jgi:hypothetical protein
MAHIEERERFNGHPRYEPLHVYLFEPSFSMKAARVSQC